MKAKKPKTKDLSEVKQLLEQSKLDGNKMQIKIWQSVLDKLNNDKKNTNRT